MEAASGASIREVGKVKECTSRYRPAGTDTTMYLMSTKAGNGTVGAERRSKETAERVPRNNPITLSSVTLVVYG